MLALFAEHRTRVLDSARVEPDGRSGLLGRLGLCKSRSSPCVLRVCRETRAQKEHQLGVQTNVVAVGNPEPGGAFPALAYDAPECREPELLSIARGKLAQMFDQRALETRKHRLLECRDLFRANDKHAFSLRQ